MGKGFKTSELLSLVFLAWQFWITADDSLHHNPVIQSLVTKSKFTKERIMSCMEPYAEFLRRSGWFDSSPSQGKGTQDSLSKLLVLPRIHINLYLRPENERNLIQAQF